MYLNNPAIQKYRWLLFIAASFAISLLLFVIVNFSRQRVIFYFPDWVTGDIVAEYRVLPREATREEKLTQYVEEAILGPVNIKNHNIFERSTRVRGLFFPERSVVVVDLSREAMGPNPKEGFSLSEAMDILRKGILSNYHGIRQVEILVDGQEPFIPVYRRQS